MKGLNAMVDELGRDEFFYSIIDRNFELAHDLIRTVENLNYQDKNGYSYLHAAVQSGLQEIVTLLIEKGADINAQDKFGRTPLMVAIIYNRDNYDMISYLVNSGANPDIKTHAGVSSRELAKKNGIEL